jgi:hypothetical protein
MKDDHQDLVKLLQSDAKKIRETEDFDPSLHQDTIRKIRRRASDDKRERGFLWSPLKVSATAVLAVTACVLVLLPVLRPTESEIIPGPVVALTADPAPGSVLAYRQALADGEDALLAMLDRDARVILPRSVAAFQSKH